MDEQGSAPKLKYPSEQTPNELELVSHVKKKVEEIRASATRISHEAVWLENSAYALGFSGLYYDTATRQFRPTDRNTPFVRRNRIHVNKILPTVQNRLAKLCKSPPKYEVRPNSTNTEDKESARLGIQILQAKWDELKLNRKRIPLYMWTQQCGHSYIKVSWDDQEGKPMVDPVSGELDYEGEVSAEVTSPFEIFPDPMAKDMDSAQYLIHAKVRKLDYFRQRYERGDLVKEEGTWLMSLQYENRIGNMNTRTAGSSAYVQGMKNTAVELAYYEKRSKKFPNGRLIISANGILLENKELPCGEIPFAKFDDIIIGGKFYSEAIITHLKSLQDQKNMIVSKRAEWVAKLLAGKYVAPRGINLSQESLNNEQGEVLMYDPVPVAPNGGEPHALQLPVIPQYAYVEEDRIDTMFNDISGISEISRGTLPSASIPAIGMQLLSEQDDARLAIITEAHEESWATVGRLILKYVEKYYQMPRLLKLAGRNLEYTVKSFTGQDLRGNTDVAVIRGSTLPGSKTLKRQDIVNTLSLGLLGNPQDPKVQEKVLGMLEFGEVSEIWQDYGLDMAQIKRGITLLEDGDMPEVSEMDNHALWLQELNRYRKTEKYDALPQEIKNRFMVVVEDHMSHLTRIMGAPQPEDKAAVDAHSEMQQANTAEQGQTLDQAAQVAPPPQPEGMQNG